MLMIDTVENSAVILKNGFLLCRISQEGLNVIYIISAILYSVLVDMIIVKKKNKIEKHFNVNLNRFLVERISIFFLVITFLR